LPPPAGAQEGPESALLGLIDVGYEDERVEVQVEHLQDVKDVCVDLQVVEDEGHRGQE